jgi:hypothetical protein
VICAGFWPVAFGFGMRGVRRFGFCGYGVFYVHFLCAKKLGAIDLAKWHPNLFTA